MINEEQFAKLMQLAGKNNVTIYQEMERNRYVLRGTGSNIGNFFIAADVSKVIIDNEEWSPLDIMNQLAGRPLLKFAFQDLVF